MSKRRNKIANTAVWILMALVLVGIIGFGRYNFGSSSQAIGTVGETEIDANRYFREVNAQLNSISQQMGQSLTFQQAQLFGIDQMALQTVIKQVSLENETARLGLSVGDAQLASRIRDISAFAGADGNFNRDTYDFVLAQSGLKPRDFEESLRSEVARTILQSAVMAGVSTPASYADTLFGWAREQRDFTWAKVDASQLDAPVGQPDAEALQAYYDAHSAEFTLPETKQITYFWLSPEDVLDQVEVSDEALRAAYDERIEEYRVPEKRLVERLVFSDTDAAQAAADAIAAGTSTFEALVADRGLKLADVDLGDVTEADLGDAGATVFALAEPGVAGPADSDLGPAIFRVNAIIAAQETSFDDAKAQLRDELAYDDARALLAGRMTALDDELAGGSTLEDLAAEEGIDLGHIGWTGSEREAIAAFDGFRSAANKVTEDDYPAIDVLSDGGLYAMRLDEITAPRLQELDEVRADAITGWQMEETQRQLVAKAETLLGQFEGGESPSSLGLTEVAETGRERSSTIDGTPPALVAKAFELAPGDWAVVEDADGALVLRLDAIHPADQTSADAEAAKLSFRQQTAQAVAQDLEDAFASAIEAQAGVALDQAMINAVNSQFQ
ncbi:MAG: SurA N-terminal domain-containing protein [Maritimibacter sp.]